MKRLIPVNGHQIYVETHGSQRGVPVVLLHHGIGAVHSWKDQTPVLAESGYRLLVYDRWGHGKSEARARLGMPYFEEDLADLEFLLNHFNFQQAALIGHSDGGKIAMYYTAHHPERVISLLVISTHIYVEPKMGPGIQGVLQNFKDDFRFREKLRRVHGEKFDLLFRAWYQGWVDPGNLSWDMRPTLGQITCPTLVIQGLEDEHASPRQAQDIAAAIPNAELWLVPGAGHMLPQDFPEVFNPKMLRFLAQTALLKQIND
jgi:pimeloyl-ACP methyl ester carboxylesterase